MLRRITTLIACTALAGCETIFKAKKYDLAKQHFLLHEWTLDYDEPVELLVTISTPEDRNRSLGGFEVSAEEHVFWVQWDFFASEKLLFHLPPTSTMTCDNIFGGSFRVIEPEGPLRRFGAIRLLESYDKTRAIFIHINKSHP